MSKNLFGFVTFGGTEFSKLAFESIMNTVVRNSFDVFVVVGKPGDSETIRWLDSIGVDYAIHTENFGFPYGINDIYDYAWKHNNYDNLIILGNDVILYPYSGDSLINLANQSDYSVISALQYDVRDLVGQFPQARKYFKGENYIIDDFSAKPWELFTGYSEEDDIAHMRMYDIQNMCLYKREVFEKIGYTDVNFYPAYFVDNDYANRIVRADIKSCTLLNARFFHFWSRVVKQGSGGSNHHFFENNKKYYRMKWGGDVGRELGHPELGIFSRDHELGVIRNWRKS